MTAGCLSLVVRKDTTSAEIASFFRKAGQRISRPDAGLRARHGIGADGQFDGTTVLYVRDHSTPATVSGRIGLLIDNVKAYFNANEEYRLAARTLLERARFAGRHEMEFQDGTKLCPSLAKISEGKGVRLTVQDIHPAWQAALTDKARMQSGAVLTALRKNIAERKGLPVTTQKNRQAPRQVVENGLKELSYLESLLSVSLDHLGHFGKRHLLALFQHLGRPVTDDSSLEVKDAIASLLHVAYGHDATKVTLSESLAANSTIDIEHIKTSIDFAGAWVRGWVIRSERNDLLKYNHILALDYLACLILTTYQPESGDSDHARQLLKKIARKKPGDNYRSIRVALEAKFVDWLRLGKPAYVFFDAKQADMQWRVSEGD